jgi:hypothetical protein
MEAVFFLLKFKLAGKDSNFLGRTLKCHFHDFSSSGAPVINDDILVGRMNIVNVLISDSLLLSQV